LDRIHDFSRKTESRLSPKGEKRLVLNLCFFLLVSAARFSHGWLATPQEVLQADWQEV
jgi:hypothetical protein